MQNRFHPGTTQKSVRPSRLLEPYLSLINVLGFINQRAQDYLITSPTAPSSLARSFGTVHGTFTRWYYASDLCHEPEGPRHFLALLLAPGNVCLDIGASHGITTRIARVAVGPLGCVYAFEPQPAGLAARDQQSNARTRRERLFGYSIDDLLSKLRALGYAAFYALRPRGL